MLRTVLHEEIQGILDGVVEMIRLVSAATSGCTQALLNADAELAQRVISADGAINAIYRKLDERAYEVLALHSPVATDLRAVLATIRMIGDVERAGDLALNIAKIAVYSHPMALPPQARECVAEMDSRARDLLATAAFAVQHREPRSRSVST